MIFRENIPQNITAMRGHGPRPGDIGVCTACGTINIYAEGQMRAPTSEEKRLIDSNTEVQAMRQQILGQYKLALPPL